MKFPGEFDAYVVYGSLPVQGAWIEITIGMKNVVIAPSLPVQGAWIEMRWKTSCPWS